MGMLTRGRWARLCPQCGGQAKRVHRRPIDRILSAFSPVVRYRCASDSCSWEGTFSVGRATDPSAADGPGRRSRALWMLAGLVVATLSVQAAFLYVRAPAGQDARPTGNAARSAPQWPAVEDGESFDGEPLAEGDLRKSDDSSPLTLRRGCAWGVPGRNRYEGSVAQALLAAKVPESAVRKFEAMVEKKLVSDQLEITRSGIVTVSGRRHFDGRSFDMAFGKTMCFNTRVNFARGHVERADLYEATDADGRRYAVMVPEVCGNVAVLGDSQEREVLADVVAIPEPTTLAMFAGGLALLAWFAHRRRQRTQGSP